MLDNLYTIYTQAHLGCGEFLTSTQLLEQHVAAAHLPCSLDAATLLLGDAWMRSLDAATLLLALTASE